MPGNCPTPESSYSALVPFNACLITIRAGKSEEEVAAYFADDGNVKQCMQSKSACPKVVDYASCTDTPEALIGILAPAGTANSSLLYCNDVYHGLPPDTCTKPFGDLVERYCGTPPVPISVVIGAVLGVIGGLALLAICARTRRSILLEREIDAAVRPGAGHGRALVSRFRGVRYNPATGVWDASVFLPTTMYYEWIGAFATEEAAARAHDNRVVVLHKEGILKEMTLNFPEQYRQEQNRKREQRAAKQKYQQMQNQQQLQQQQIAPGMLQFGKGGNGGAGVPMMAISPAAQPSVSQYPQIAAFNQQHQRARENEYSAAAMQRQSRMGQSASSMNSARYLAYTSADSPENRQRHITELIAFYNYYEPQINGGDVAGHVVGLFDKYRFMGLAAGIRNKYGVLPYGWEDEIAMVRAQSMSHRISSFFLAGRNRNYSNAGWEDRESSTVVI